MNKPPPPDSSDRWLYWFWKWATTLNTSGGTGASITSLLGTLPVIVSGSTGTLTVAHATSGVAAGSYGGTAGFPRFDISAHGHVTSGSNVKVEAQAPILLTMGAGTAQFSHDTSGVAAGTYGTGGNIPRIVVDAKGHILSATDTVGASAATLIVGSSPIVITGSNTGTYTVAHDTSGVVTGTYGGSGGTSGTATGLDGGFTIPSLEVNKEGHIVSALRIPAGRFIITTHTAAGTWTKPENALIVGALVYSGGGGGGGGGGVGTSTTLNLGVGGGGGGGGSAMEFRFWSAAELAAKQDVVIGAGGAGGASPLSGGLSAGNTGSPGGTSTFVGVSPAPGLGGGRGGTAADPGGTGGAGGTSSPASAAFSILGTFFTIRISTNTGTNTTTSTSTSTSTGTSPPPWGFLRWSAAGGSGGAGGPNAGNADGSGGASSTSGGASGGAGGASGQFTGTGNARALGGTGGSASILRGGSAGGTSSGSQHGSAGDSSFSTSGIRGGAGGGGGSQIATTTKTNAVPANGGVGGNFGGGGGGGAGVVMLGTGFGGAGATGVVVVISIVG